MNRPVAVLVLVSLLATVAALGMVLFARRRPLRSDLRLALIALLVAISVHYLSDVLEWFFLKPVLDPIEDYLEIIEAALWGGVLYAFCQDVGSRDLRRSEARYRTLIENIGLGITLIDSNFTVVMANATQERFVGRSAGSLIGQKCFRLFRCAGAPCSNCPGVRAMASRRPAGWETECVGADGERRPVWVRAFPLVDDDGTISSFIQVMEDITVAKEAEQERRRLEAQVRHAQKLESLGVLAGGIAHDFNNLLVAVMGNADLLLTELPASSPVRIYVDEIKRAAHRASGLTNQMLSYSGKGSFVIEPINLNNLVADMGELLEVSISKKVSLRYELAAPPPVIRGDISQIRQILMNLITNASEAIGDEVGTITIATETRRVDRSYLASTYLNEDLPAGPYAVLTVADTGCGMDATVRARLFDPFFTTKFSGRGLGMAAVLGIVRSHRGAIDVHSRVGEGATLTVMLPVAEEAAPAAEVEPTEEVVPRVGGGTVLVVDDETSVREIASKMLQVRGFDVLIAADGREAVEVYRRRGDDIDVVLLDMTMPEMNGEEAFAELRRIRSDVRVVLTSGYSEGDVAGRFAGEGPVGFIQKPFEMNRLIDAVSLAMADRSPSAESKD